MKHKELTAEEINEHIEKFTQIYKDGNEINPIPKDKKVTVWCNGGGDEGFICNVTLDELGLEVLIAKSWIFEDVLQQLCKK